MKVILNGFMTISEKILTDEQKDQVLAAKPGHVKVLKIELLDGSGKTHILEGKLKKSKNNNLTARFVAHIDNFEVVEKEDTGKKTKTSDSEESCLAKLGI